MEEAALRAERRTVPPIDIHRLRKFARTVLEIGPQLHNAFEGEQRTVFEELCTYIQEQNIQPAPDETLKADMSIIVLAFITALLGLVIIKIALLWRARRCRRFHVHKTNPNPPSSRAFE